MTIITDTSAVPESSVSTGTSSSTNGHQTGQFNLLPHVYMLSKHLNGSLNLWKVNSSYLLFILGIKMNGLDSRLEINDCISELQM